MVSESTFAFATLVDRSDPLSYLQVEAAGIEQGRPRFKDAHGQIYEQGHDGLLRRLGVQDEGFVIDEAGQLYRQGADDALYAVIDPIKTRRCFDTAPMGFKRVPTLVLCAEGGEHTAQIFKGNSEVKYPYIAQKDEAIFVQGDLKATLHYLKTGAVLDDQATIDCYVPDNAVHTAGGYRVMFENLLKEGYLVQPPNPRRPGTYVISPPAPVLERANKIRACIDYPGIPARFFQPDSSFKLTNDRISGINPEAFLESWATQSALPFTGTFLRNNEGIYCMMLDRFRVDFARAVLGRKKEPTLVIEAKGGEWLATINADGWLRGEKIQAQPGQAIFIQGDIQAALAFMATGVYTPTGKPIDIYVPNNAKTNPDPRDKNMRFSALEAEGFERAHTNTEGPGVYFLSPPALLIPNANHVPMCIPYDEPGENGQPEFFMPGATVKWQGGHISGISRRIFLETWDVFWDPTPSQSALRDKMIADFKDDFYPAA